jgi:hypothetical protein
MQGIYILKKHGRKMERKSVTLALFNRLNKTQMTTRTAVIEGSCSQ